MEALREFMERTPPKGVRVYFDQRGITYPANLPWDDFLIITLHLQQATERLPESKLMELDAECLRINRMSTLAGQAALESMVINWASYSLLEDQYERSCWVFLNETDAFAQAESLILFNDCRGKTQKWNRFGSTTCLSEASVRMRQQGFNALVQKELRGDQNCHTHIFVHQQHSQRIQLDIHREQLPIREPSFAQHGDLISSLRKPVTEFIILYDSASGQFEITSGKTADRRMLAGLFAREILRTHDYRDITQCHYELSSLHSYRSFQMGDGMTDVKVVEVGFYLPTLDIVQSVKLTSQGVLHATLYEKLEKLWGGSNSHYSEAEIRYVKLCVSFRSSRQHPKGRVVTFRLSEKSCNLDYGKNHPEETLIRAHYLKLWGLEKETPSWLLS